MLTADKITDLLFGACPSFARAYREQSDELEPNLYSLAGDLAHWLHEAYLEGKETELVAAGKAIERIHVEGSAWVREFGTIGILEGIQNVWLNLGTEPTAFLKYLGPESTQWWHRLNDFWNGNLPASSHIDEHNSSQQSKYTEENDAS